MMLKYLSASILATTLWINVPSSILPVRAESCPPNSRCILRSVQFVPGEQVTVEMVNLTNNVVEVQQPSGTDPLTINPGEEINFLRGGSADRNFSVVFWDSAGSPVKVNVEKTEAQTLRIEVNPGIYPPGDRSIYLRNDGRLDLF